MIKKFMSSKNETRKNKKKEEKNEVNQKKIRKMYHKLI